jgi:4-hydroxy-tetrahydrodipicolinate synthase
MERSALEGLIPAIVTPMTVDFKIDEAALRAYLAWIAEQRPSAIAINTDAGEGPHMTPDEKRRNLVIAHEVLGGRVPVVAGLGAPTTHLAVDAAKDARDAGASALLVFPQTAFRGARGADPVIIAYHEAVAQAGLPMIIFQLQPALGGTEYPPETLARLVEIDQVVAIKEATFDAVKYVETVSLLRSLPKRIAILTGNDNFILESFVLGGDGALIGMGAVATREQVEMIAAARRGDWPTASRIYERLQPLIRCAVAQPVRDYRARIKEALVVQGVLPRAVVRPPLLPLTPEARLQVRQAVEASGLMPVAR